MLKNFNKTNFNNSVTITLLLISLIIIINNFFRFFQTKTAYQFAPWLNNYQGGFVRRGLPGEIFFQIHEIFLLYCFCKNHYSTNFYILKKVLI